jgi:molybdate transport system ATP-binding protein
MNDTPVLDDVSFTLHRHERWVIVGPNGAGKSMLLKLLRGDVWPTPTGAEERLYYLDGVADRSPGESKKRIAYVGPERQDRYVRYDWNFKVAQIVATGLFDEEYPLTRPTPAQHARVARLMKRFGLWGLRERRMLTLSYGQRRRVLVARAFASDAQVLLLDEAFNGLDDRSRRALSSALQHARGRGPSWIVTTHRAVELPNNVTHIARIEAGRILEAGPVVGSLRTLVTRLQRRSRPRRISADLQQRATKSKHPVLIKLKDVALYRDYRPVLHDLNWTLHAGEHWAVLGRNGSGKSTLLLLLYGDLHPALGGSVARAGAPVGTPIAQWKQRVGFVSPELQADHFQVGTLEEIVASGRYASVGLNETPTAADRRIARRWLRHFGLESLADRGPRQVSYGQLRLTLIARAMVNDPDLLLLDEPCTGLDPDVHGEVLEIIEGLAQRGTQIVMAVHDEQDVIPSVKHVLKIERGGKVVCASRVDG